MENNNNNNEWTQEDLARIIDKRHNTKEVLKNVEKGQEGNVLFFNTESKRMHENSIKEEEEEDSSSEEDEARHSLNGLYKSFNESREAFFEGLTLKQLVAFTKRQADYLSGVKSINTIMISKASVNRFIAMFNSYNKYLKFSKKCKKELGYDF